MFACGNGWLVGGKERKGKEIDIERVFGLVSLGLVWFRLVWFGCFALLWFGFIQTMVVSVCLYTLAVVVRSTPPFLPTVQPTLD